MFAPAGPDGLFYEISALAAGNGGVINDSDPRIEALTAKYDTEHVGPPILSMFSYPSRTDPAGTDRRGGIGSRPRLTRARRPQPGRGQL